MNDDINGIFDHLTPDDFARTTSAVDEKPGFWTRRPWSATEGGAVAFEDWTNEQLRITRTSYVAADGEFHPTAVLASSELQRTFTPDDDETLGQFVQRVATEARLMGAVWTFVQKKTMVGVMQVEGPLPSVNDAANVEALRAAGTLSLGIAYFAERHENGERHHRVGSMVETETGRLGEPVEMDQTIPLFAQILDA